MASSTIPNSTVWKYAGTATGVGAEVSLPSSWDEIIIIAYSIGYGFTFNVTNLYAASSSGATKKLLNGYANQSGGSYWACEVQVSPTMCKCMAFMYGTVSQTPTIEVYYR